jgi:hypothetical protein
MFNLNFNESGIGMHFLYVAGERSGSLCREIAEKLGNGLFMDKGKVE